MQYNTGVAEIYTYFVLTPFLSLKFQIDEAGFFFCIDKVLWWPGFIPILIIIEKQNLVSCLVNLEFI